MLGRCSSNWEFGTPPQNTPQLDTFLPNLT